MNKKNILIGILSVLFIILIVLIETHVIDSFDTSIYNIVTLKMNDTITVINKIITFLGSTIFIVSLCVVLFFLFLILKKKNISFIIASCLIISTIFNNVVKLIIRRPRPEVLRLVTEKSFSFPSGHTMGAISMYGIILYLIIKSNLNKNVKLMLGIIFSILPILVGISRIYLGAHFASDIIGGIILALTLILIETSIIAKNKWL